MLSPVRLPNMQHFWLPLVTAAGVLLTTGSAQAQSIDASQHHTCVSTKSGQLYCWGRVGWWPIEVPALPPDSVVLSPATIGPRHSTRARYRSIATGWLHDCALRRDRVIVCNGNNGSGELGRGGTFDAPPPRLATAHQFELVTAGLNHTCALTAQGAAYCWGDNFAGQVGNGTRAKMVTRPTPVIGGHRFRQLTAGDEHTCGITTRGRTLCWGANTRGQLGRDPALSGCRPDKACMAVPRPPDDRHRFRTLSAGGNHTCGVTIADELFCWGDQYSDYQQVGRPPRALLMTLLATPAPIRSMSSGHWSTCGLTEDGKAFCWGAGVGRRLVQSQCQGAATCLDSVPVSRTIRFRALAVGDRHACGIGRSGNVYCWGIRDVRKIGSAQSPADHPPPCSPMLVNADARCAVEPFQVLVPNVYTGELPRR